MAIIMMLELPGVTTDQFDQVNDILGIHRDEDLPDGLISHVAGATGNGFLVVDVWESEEALGRFFEERVAGAMAQVGLQLAEPRIVPVHRQLRRRAA